MLLVARLVSQVNQPLQAGYYLDGCAYQPAISITVCIRGVYDMFCMLHTRNTRACYISTVIL